MSCSLRIIFFKYFTFFILSIFSLSCAVSRNIRYDTSGTTSEIPLVRILLNEPSSNLKLNLSNNIILFADGNEVQKAAPGDVLEFTASGNVNLKSGRRKLKAESFLIKPDGFFVYHDKKLTGNIKIIAQNNQLYLINYTGIEDYLKGVLPYEMPLGRNEEYLEGLKAFAICARTFTLKKLMEGRELFDVRTDVRDQVYGGMAGRREISDKSVDITRGMILTYNDIPATVFYFSTCGGRTEDVENVFGNKPIPYLKSIEDGNPVYCSVSPQISWEEKFSNDRIIGLLRRSGKIDNSSYRVADIEIKSRFRSGKVNELEITLSETSGKKIFTLNGNNIRFVLLKNNNQPLNSNDFVVRTEKGEYILTGKGWGHAVGFCQWGALAQSMKGNNYKDILLHYFPGTTIKRHYD